MPKPPAEPSLPKSDNRPSSNSGSSVYRLPRYRHHPPPPPHKKLDSPASRSSSKPLDPPAPHLRRSQSLDRGASKQAYPKNLDASRQQKLDSETERKKNFWNWRSFRTALNVEQCFHVIFSLRVHKIESLPASLDGIRLAVSWNHKEEGLQSMPVRVHGGIAIFDETLRQRCTINGTRSASDVITYEPKLFTVSLVALDSDKLEFGKQQFDLSRLLLDHVDSKAGTSWRTTFKLTGSARGSTLHLTFSYDIVHHDSTEDPSYNFVKTAKLPALHSYSTTSLSTLLASSPNQHFVESEHNNPQSLSILKHTDPVPVPGLTDLLSDAHSLFEHKSTLEYFPKGDDRDNFSFSQAEVFSQNDKGSSNLGYLTAEKALGVNEGSLYGCAPGISNTSSDCLSSSQEVSLQSGNSVGSSYGKVGSLGCETSIQQPDLDEEVDLVAGEFLNLLDIGENSESEPDSLRSELLKGFETFQRENELVLKEGELSDYISQRALWAGPNSGLDNDIQLAEIMEAAEAELQKATQTMRSKSRAKVLEDAETQALMQEWGLSEKSFEGSMSPECLNSPSGRAFKRSSLGQGLGSVIDLGDGGSLRSMSPTHFPKGYTCGSLAMQVSRPVVVPSAGGSSAVDVLRHLASFGTENLARQAMAAMPLDDITGKTADEVAEMGMLKVHDFNQVCSNTRMRPKAMTEHALHKGMYDSTGMLDEYVSLEDLAPLAMHDIEALAVDGLKIQTEILEEEAPSYLDSTVWGAVDDFKKEDKNNFGTSNGVAGMHFSKADTMEDSSLHAKQGGPLSMALTLEEWTKLDAGVYDEDDASKEKTLAILAAHNPKHIDLAVSKFDANRGRPKSKGIMGNTLMIAMLVQLRDPLQNFEPVGAPMLALIQAERLMMPLKPKIWKPVFAKGNSEQCEDAQEVPTLVKMEIPQFKVTGVHMSGLKEKDNEIKPAEGQKRGWWGSQKQLQSGSRWLAAQGMGKSHKPSLLKPKAAFASTQIKSKPGETEETKVKPGETLWSISARLLGSGKKWRDLANLNPHIRNPDVILPNDIIRTK